MIRYNPSTSRRTVLGLVAAGMAARSNVAGAQAVAPVKLPAPRADFGQSLARSLKARRSRRNFADTVLPAQVLSELLWCAYGVNRLASQDRTAPSWRHTRETEVFAVMANGTWRYDPIEHRLMAHLTDDIRGETGTQSYAAGAPLHLIYVSDAAHMSGVARDEQRRFAAADAGFIGQNVYLYCASEGLACVFRTAPEQDRLVHAMKLAASQFVEFAQTVGYPKG